ncbi:hypothetical protein J3459_006531 [Metarhizium acridum]|nr:hypothetical protein J3459_006531 [Metarhizium acridum]
MPSGCEAPVKRQLSAAGPTQPTSREPAAHIWETSSSRVQGRVSNVSGNNAMAASITQARAISRPFVGSAEKQSLTERLATSLHHAIRRLDAENRGGASSPTVDHPVTVVCISDTHNSFPSSLPPGDILLHAGDLSRFGTFAEIQAQISWLAAQPHSHKVIIAGNHDLLLDPAFVATHPDRELDRWPGQRRSDLAWGDVHYLDCASVDLVIEGKGRSIRVLGSPWTPRCGSWAFQYDQNRNDEDTCYPLGTSPNDVDVMLVHGPPKGYLDDGGKGCERLLTQVWRARPKLVVCGHIHTGRGEGRLNFDLADNLYKNVMLGKRRWLSVLCLAVCHLWHMVISFFGVASNRGEGRQTHLVNAAIVRGGWDSGLAEPIVVLI